MKKVLALFLAMSGLLSVPALARDALEMMSIAFVGKPSRATVEPLVKQVLNRFDRPHNEDNYMKVGDIAVNLRKNSRNVTEMQILRCMTEMPARLGLENAAAYCTTMLERR